MEPIITKNTGATYIDNDRNAFHADRGGLNDTQYEQIITEKNSQIASLQAQITELQAQITELEAQIAELTPDTPDTPEENTEGQE